MAKVFKAAVLALTLLPLAPQAPAMAAARQTVTQTATQAATQFKPEDVVVGAWWLYKAFFVEGGRVIDRSNGNISHSEGQGYGMLLAVAADDREAFEQIWAWTRRELYVRGDELAAWKWDPAAATGHVVDTNNASDGDLLIAWALMRAGEKWGVADHTEAARRIADAIAEKLVLRTADHGVILLPAAKGFGTGEQPDGPVVNLSYWVFPALADLGRLGSKLPVDALQTSGRKLIEAARFGVGNLPADWLSLGEKTPKPAARFAPNFGYEAVRLPLYAAWAGPENASLLEAVQQRWNRDGHNRVQVVELATTASLVSMPDPGYRAVSELLSCSLGKSNDPAVITGFTPTEYYPSTLHLMSLVAISERYPQCVQNLN